MDLLLLLFLIVIGVAIYSTSNYKLCKTKNKSYYISLVTGLAIVVITGLILLSTYTFQIISL